jgi:hypothetical protein
MSLLLGSEAQLHDVPALLIDNFHVRTSISVLDHRTQGLSRLLTGGGIVRRVDSLRVLIKRAMEVVERHGGKTAAVLLCNASAMACVSDCTVWQSATLRVAGKLLRGHGS